MSRMRSEAVIYCVLSFMDGVWELDLIISLVGPGITCKYWEPVSKPLLYKSSYCPVISHNGHRMVLCVIKLLDITVQLRKSINSLKLLQVISETK